MEKLDDNCPESMKHLDLHRRPRNFKGYSFLSAAGQVINRFSVSLCLCMSLSAFVYVSV